MLPPRNLTSTEAESSLLASASVFSAVSTTSAASLTSCPSLKTLQSLHLYDINTSHFNWLSLHSRKLIDNNDIEELFTLCKANLLIDKQCFKRFIVSKLWKDAAINQIDKRFPQNYLSTTTNSSISCLQRTLFRYQRNTFWELNIMIINMKMKTKVS